MEISNVFPMTDVDLPEVQVLVNQLGYSVELTELQARYLGLITLPNHALMVWKEDKALGIIHLEEVFDLIEENKVEIKALVVDENIRGKGIGKAMITFARKWAAERGASMIYLNCNIKREKAHAFYQREGFILNRTSHFFERKV